MTKRNQLSLRKLVAVPLFGVALIIATAGLSGCTVAPKSIPNASVAGAGGDATAADADCSADCGDENGTSRYQYYLGILSVLLIR